MDDKYLKNTPEEPQNDAQQNQDSTNPDFDVKDEINNNIKSFEKKGSLFFADNAETNDKKDETTNINASESPNISNARNFDDMQNILNEFNPSNQQDDLKTSNLNQTENTNIPQTDQNVFEEKNLYTTQNPSETKDINVSPKTTQIPKSENPGTSQTPFDAQNLPRSEEKPNFDFMQNSPQTETKPTFDYTQNSPQTDEKPAFDYTLNSSQTDEKPIHDYTQNPSQQNVQIPNDKNMNNIPYTPQIPNSYRGQNFNVPSTSYGDVLSNRAEINNQEWQQSPQTPSQAISKSDDEYKWDIADYSQYDKKIRKQNKPNKMIAALLVMIILLTTAVGVLGYSVANERGLFGDNSTPQLSSKQEKNANAPQLNLEDTPINNNVPSGIETDIVSIASKARPSVVGIEVYVQEYRLRTYGQGSGVIMSNDGYIISNAHVFMINERQNEYVNAIKVVLDDGKEYEAELIGADSRTDLAVIKINAKGLPKATFGDSDKVEVGESVLVIGNAGGMEFFGSVTKGIISGTNRNAANSGYATSLIQTDAAINPGNSGGALVNMHGQVIGINSSKIVAEGYEGLGFSIPISEARPIIDDLIKFGYVQGRVRIGITYEFIDEIKARFNDVPQGVYITSIDESLDVAKKGVRVNDIITKIDGKDIIDPGTVLNVLKTKKVGETVKLTIFRQTALGSADTFTVDVILAEDNQRARE